jgi:hypothetical protein
MAQGLLKRRVVETGSAVSTVGKHAEHPRQRMGGFGTIHLHKRVGRVVVRR